MRKSAPLDQLIQFTLHDDCVESGGEFFRFYRYFPPNTDIMTEDEIAQEIENLSSLFDSIDQAFAMFSTDKIEDMSRIREYYASLDPRFDAYVPKSLPRSIQLKKTALRCSGHSILSSAAKTGLTIFTISSSGADITSSLPKERDRHHAAKLLHPRVCRL